MTACKLLATSPATIIVRRELNSRIRRTSRANRRLRSKGARLQVQSLIFPLSGTSIADAQGIAIRRDDEWECYLPAVRKDW